jgi:hypothetical protein
MDECAGELLLHSARETLTPFASVRPETAAGSAQYSPPKSARVGNAWLSSNHFNEERHLITRQVYKQKPSKATCVASTSPSPSLYRRIGKSLISMRNSRTRDGNGRVLPA